MSAVPQTFENHARVVPLFHMVALPILAINFLWSLYSVVTRFEVANIVALFVAFALIVVALFARGFAVRVQDRVIRLEMRLRLRDLLPADLQARIGEFTLSQLVALRFAPDEELPALARRVLDERLTDRKAIKRLVHSWQADTLRV